MAQTFNTSDFDAISLQDSLGNPIAVDFELQLDEEATLTPDEVAALVESIVLRIESGEREGKLHDSDGTEIGWFSTK